ncbi:MAG: PEP-CTERM sorting domain-containing protein [Verrucomicrobiota bacterium]
MKALSLLLASLIVVTKVHGQGTLYVSPVPITNGLTGTLADSGIVAALYGGPSGWLERDLILMSSVKPLSNGFATFDSPIAYPFPAGISMLFQARAWSAGYVDYEAAIGSGLPSVLAGKSGVLGAIIGGASGPPPIPNPLVFSAFTVMPVPEPATMNLLLLGVGILCWCWKIRPGRFGSWA